MDNNSACQKCGSTLNLNDMVLNGRRYGVLCIQCDLDFELAIRKFESDILKDRLKRLKNFISGL